MASLGTIWTVGLSVLGIYVYKRSQEKRSLLHDAHDFATGTDRLNRLFRADSVPKPGRKPDAS